LGDKFTRDDFCVRSPQLSKRIIFITGGGTGKMKSLISLFVIVGCLLTYATSHAIPTTITVRVISKGAKFVGTSMGGAQITIRNNMTKELLASGTTKGSTGNTEKVMKAGANRNSTLSDDTSAKFTTTIDISEPALIEVTAFGPQAQLQSANRVSATQWIIPGKHIDGGDAWLLELPGFVVDILSPPTHLVLEGVSEPVLIKANITMMCGCPIVPGGLWDASGYEIKAIITKDGKPLETVPLSYADKPSQFEALIPVRGKGVYKVTVYAYDASNGNTGIDSVTYIIK
jgi:hypothetical protein